MCVTIAYFDGTSIDVVLLVQEVDQSNLFGDNDLVYLITAHSTAFATFFSPVKNSIEVPLQAQCIFRGINYPVHYTIMGKQLNC